MNRSCGTWQYLPELPYRACSPAARRHLRNLLISCPISDPLSADSGAPLSLGLIAHSLPETDGFFLMATLEAIGRACVEPETQLINDVVGDILKVSRYKII